MSEFLLNVVNWLVPPFLVYIIHPIFMGMVILSRLRRWWQILLLAEEAALFNLAKAIWGIYSTPASVFRILAGSVLLICVPLLFLEGPVWKRLLINLLMFSSQAVGEGVAVSAVTSPANVRIETVVVHFFADGMVYAGVALLCIILIHCILIVFTRSLQGKISGVYIPLICIVFGLWGIFYAYISDANGLLCCICLILAGASLIDFLYYVVSLKNKSPLEEELREIRYRVALEQTHYKAVETRQKELARIRHDFNNQLSTINQLIYMARISLPRGTSYCVEMDSGGNWLTTPEAVSLLKDDKNSSLHAGVKSAEIPTALTQWNDQSRIRPK